MTKPTDTQIDLIEKWMLTVSLMGLTDVKELWDSDGETYNTLNFMEELETHKNLLDSRDVAMMAAVRAQQMGVTTGLLTEYVDYRAEVLYNLEQARLVEEETNNNILNLLRNEHNFKLTIGPKITQHYWSFTGDIGHGGTFDYKCRIVKISWNSMRVWTEWTDDKGLFHREKQLDSRYNYSMSMEWPELWRQHSNTPSYARLPYVYTRFKLLEEYNRKAQEAIRIEKRKARQLKRMAAKQSIDVKELS